MTKVLGKRSQQLNTLLLNADALLGVLSDRRQAIIDLMAATSAVTLQLRGVVADNEEQLGPTLDRLNSVTAVLEKNRDNITKMLPDMKKFMLSQGETLANGPYYNAFVPNLGVARSHCSRSWTTRSASGAVSTPVSRRTMPARAPNFHCPTTGFPEAR